jgi:hypothetical protein
VRLFGDNRTALSAYFQPLPYWAAYEPRGFWAANKIVPGFFNKLIIRVQNPILIKIPQRVPSPFLLNSCGKGWVVINTLLCRQRRSLCERSLTPIAGISSFRNSLGPPTTLIEVFLGFPEVQVWYGGTRWRSVRGTALQTGRSRVRIPVVSLDFFIDIILPGALWPWGRLSL